MDLSEKADALEERMIDALEQRIPMPSSLYTSGPLDPRRPFADSEMDPGPGKAFLMGPDPRNSRMPDKPTLIDFFHHRLRASQHLTQSARLAQKNGLDEKVVLACLLHDIAVLGFIRSDHGFWGAQLIEPYVDPEISWAIRAHQVLRFYPDPAVGYEYPQVYRTFFGDDYEPEPHIAREYEIIRKHEWYMTARLITMNDLYSFEPDVFVDVEEFTDVIGRNFRQPAEGLGFDRSPSAHMWRTLNWPTRFL